MSKVVNKLLTKSNLADWLAERHPRSRVGIRDGYADGVVAKFLRSHGLRVDEETLDEIFSKKRWAGRYDDTLYDTGPQCSSICANHALNTLRRLTA